MPAWTLGEIMSRATTWAGYRDDIAESDVSFFANQAQLDFMRDFEEFLSEKTTGFSVSSGDSILSLPADFRQAVALSETTTGNNANRLIPQIASERADALGYFPAAEPKGYFIHANKIQLWPSASSSQNTTAASSGRSLHLRYRGIADDMVSTSSEPSVHTEHRIALVYKTMEYVHYHVGNLEEAALAEARYTSLIQSFKDAHYKRQAERGGFKIALKDRASRRLGGSLDGRIEDQDEWLRQ